MQEIKKDEDEDEDDEMICQAKKFASSSVFHLFFSTPQLMSKIREEKNRDKEVGKQAQPTLVSGVHGLTYSRLLRQS